MHPGNFNPWYPGPGYFNHRPPVFFYSAYRCRMFPRLFWFALGAGAYAFWSTKREENRYIGAGGHNGEWKHWSNHHFGCHRRRDQPSSEQLQQQQQQMNATAVPPQYPQHTAVAPAVAAPPVTAPPYQQSPPSSPPDTSAEWPTERVREVTKQASDTVADMSENALDALMANLQSLKAKIRETREAREKERAYLEQRIPKDKPDQRDPPPSERLV